MTERVAALRKQLAARGRSGKNDDDFDKLMFESGILLFGENNGNDEPAQSSASSSTATSKWSNSDNQIPMTSSSQNGSKKQCLPAAVHVSSSITAMTETYSGTS